MGNLSWKNSLSIVTTLSFSDGLSKKVITALVQDRKISTHNIAFGCGCIFFFFSLFLHICKVVFFLQSCRHLLIKTKCLKILDIGAVHLCTHWIQESSYHIPVIYKDYNCWNSNFPLQNPDLTSEFESAIVNSSISLPGASWIWTRADHHHVPRHATLGVWNIIPPNAVNQKTHQWNYKKKRRGDRYMSDSEEVKSKEYCIMNQYMTINSVTDCVGL